MNLPRTASGVISATSVTPRGPKKPTKGKKETIYQYFLLTVREE